VLDGARVASAHIRGAGADLVVRTVQRTLAGEVVEVLQSRAASGQRDQAMAEMPAAAAAQPLGRVEGAAERETAASTVRWRDWTVTISGAVERERLDALLEDLP
jgi:hypothetical protein